VTAVERDSWPQLVDSKGCRWRIDPAVSSAGPWAAALGTNPWMVDLGTPGAMAILWTCTTRPGAALAFLPDLEWWPREVGICPELVEAGGRLRVVGAPLGGRPMQPGHPFLVISQSADGAAGVAALISSPAGRPSASSPARSPRSGRLEGWRIPDMDASPTVSPRGSGRVLEVSATGSGLDVDAVLTISVDPLHLRGALIVRQAVSTTGEVQRFPAYEDEWGRFRGWMELGPLAGVVREGVFADRRGGAMAPILVRSTRWAGNGEHAWGLGLLLGNSGEGLMAHRVGIFISDLLEVVGSHLVTRRLMEM
jgi:hypothetical protein